MDLNRNSEKSRAWVELHWLPTGWYIEQDGMGSYVKIVDRMASNRTEFHASSWVALLGYAEGLQAGREYQNGTPAIARKVYMPKDFIKEIAERTANNDHTSARILIAGTAAKHVGAVTKAMNLHDQYAEIKENQRKRGFVSMEDSSLSHALDRELKELIHWAFENGHAVWGAL